MKFVRTASTSRLLATIVGLILAIAAGTAIAVAATNSTPVPKAEPLADAVHGALGASPVKGISAHITFTNGLINSDDFSGGTTDPLLQGARGRLWLSGQQLRLELQGDNGDAQVIVNGRAFMISDPASSTVYEGTLPADMSSSTTKSTADQGVPSISEIRSDITRLMQRVTLTGAGTSNPGDVAGRPTYSVKISPQHSGGELGKLALAWDAVTGTPLDIAVYSSSSSTPVLEVKVSRISYGAVSPSVFNIPPPPGYQVVKVSGAQQSTASKALKKGMVKHADVSGVSAVAGHIPFTLVAPTSAVGLPRHDVTLLNWGGTPAALVTYGQGLGAIAVIEQKATAAGASTSSSQGQAQGQAQAQGQGSNLSLPTVSINGATGQELDTALGTMVRFTRAGVTYTVIGSVTPYAADQAARALTP
jgi:outer membrane lipoprotein-sorting protein